MECSNELSACLAVQHLDVPDVALPSTLITHLKIPRIVIFLFDNTDAVSEITIPYIDKAYRASIVGFGLCYQLGCYEC